MRVRFHRNFEKQYRKLRPEEKQRFRERRDLFIKNVFHPLLKNHALRGAYAGYRSVNVGGDLRAIYKLAADDLALFVTIGTHNDLYS